ncbi:MAG: hypothetical protein ACRCWM_01165 [Sarcina sp.]|uniref:hypothetical protein n=1 Tax=Clostridium sp. TaxID=1506 RepID=UPI003F34DB61
MIEKTKEKLRNIGSGQYFMNLLILIFVWIANIMAGGTGYDKTNSYISYIVPNIIVALYVGYYKVYLMNFMINSKNVLMSKKKFFNIVVCNYIVAMIIIAVARYLVKNISSNILIVVIMAGITYFTLIILEIIVAPIEYVFYSQECTFVEGVILGMKILNKKKKILMLNNVKILGTHILNILTAYIFTIKSSSMIIGINYTSIIDEN